MKLVIFRPTRNPAPTRPLPVNGTVRSILRAEQAVRLSAAALLVTMQVLSTGCASSQRGQRADAYFPSRAEWQRRSPAQVGMDSAKLAEAVQYALSREATWDFGRDQVRTFGRPLGPLPEKRATTNGIILRHGYIVATFGDTKASDPVYSVAKSFLSTIAGLAVDRRLIASVNDPVANYIRDGGYDSPQNRLLTWKQHLQQSSEWEGSLWGKPSGFVGAAEFGAGSENLA